MTAVAWSGLRRTTSSHVQSYNDVGSTYSDASSAHATHNGATTVNTHSSVSGGSDQATGIKPNFTLPPPPTRPSPTTPARGRDSCPDRRPVLAPRRPGRQHNLEPTAQHLAERLFRDHRRRHRLPHRPRPRLPASSTPTGVYAVRSADSGSNTTTTAPPTDSASNNSSTGPGTDSPPDLLTSPPSYIPAHDDPGQFIRPGWWYGFDRAWGTYGWHPGSPPPGFTMGFGGWGPQYWSNRGTGNEPGCRR